MKHFPLGLILFALLGCNQIKKQETTVSETMVTSAILIPESKNILYL